MIEKLEKPYHERQPDGLGLFRPTNDEIVDKINEIIEFLNSKEKV